MINVAQQSKAHHQMNLVIAGQERGESSHSATTVLPLSPKVCKNATNASRPSNENAVNSFCANTRQHDMHEKITHIAKCISLPYG